MKNHANSSPSYEVQPPRFFVDRLPRFALNVPVTFRTEAGSMVGYCINVSASGMLVAFAEPAELFTVGEVSLLAGEYYVSMQARVARTDGKDAGLAFLISTENDRAASLLLADFAAARM
jgi:hypothetical protein